MSEEVFPVVHGSLVVGSFMDLGDIMSDTSNGQDEWSDQDTDVPEEALSDTSESDVSAVQEEDAASPLSDSSMARPLMWGEIPVDFLVEDVFEPAVNSWSAQEAEFVSLMQGQRGTSSAHTGEPQEISVQDGLPPMHPAVQCLSSHLEATQASFPVEVVTWCVSSTHPVCGHPIHVQLSEDRCTWEETLVMAWFDILSVQSAYVLEICLVDSEQRTAPATSPHVLMRPQDTTGESMSLVTTRHTDGTFSRCLHFAHPAESIEQLVRRIDRHASDSHCVDVHNDQGRPPPPWGSQVIVHHSHARSTSDISDSFDSVTLMQRPRSRSPARAAALSRHQPTEEGDPNQEEDPEEEDSGSPDPADAPDDMVEWHILYADMPVEPIPIQASLEGPSVSQVAQAIHFPVASIAQLYVVHWLFDSFRDYVVLVELHEDRVDHSRDAIILFDVHCLSDPENATEDANVEEPHLFHSLHIGRQQYTFQTLLGATRLTRLQRLHPDCIRVFHNGELWQPQESAPHHINNGDHIEVEIANTRNGLHTVELIEWLLDEGIGPWPSLFQNPDPDVISPTLPFSIRQEIEDEVGSVYECQPHPGPQFSGIAFNSWYVSHNRHVSCTESRVLIFSQQQASWKEAIARIWEDRFDRSRPYSVSWCMPRPPQTGRPEYDALPHVMVEQQHARGKAGVLLATSYVDTAPGTVDLMAVSAPDLMTANTAFELASVASDCQRDRRCTAYHEDRRLNDHELAHAPSGAVITIQIAGRANSAQGNGDAVSFMQSPPSAPLMCPDTGGSQDNSVDLEVRGNSAGEQYGDPASESPDINSLASLRQLHGMFALPIQGPARTGIVATYYLSPERLRSCAFARPVSLDQDFVSWRDKLVEAWEDIAERHAPHQIHVVTPLPHQNAGSPGFVAFVIVTQHLQAFDSTALFTTEEDGHFIHMAFITPTLMDESTVLETIGYQQRCDPAQSGNACTVRIGPRDVSHGEFVRVHQGCGVHIRIASMEAADESQLLQTGITPPLSPRNKRQISIADSLNLSCEVFLLLIDANGLFSESWVSPQRLQELQDRFPSGRKLQWEEKDRSHLVLDIRPNGVTYVFRPLKSELNDATETHCFHSPNQDKWDEMTMLSKLYTVDQHRAVLHAPSLESASGISLWYYSQQDPTLEKAPKIDKEPTPWPEPQPVPTVHPTSLRCVQAPCDPGIQIKLPCSSKVVMDIVGSNWITLTTSTMDLNIPAEFQIQADPGVSFQDFDRLLIFTDGSAKVEDQPTGHDMGWAFVVVGERYGTPPAFLGWLGEPVCSDSASPRHIRSSSMHSTRAEIEALIWAAQWRLSLNMNMATAVLTDSMVGKQTALGEVGHHGSWGGTLLRGAYQALEAICPGPLLVVQHTRGHSGQYWNDMADQLAGWARRQPHLSSSINPPHNAWQMLIPHLWLLLRGNIASIWRHRIVSSSASPSSQHPVSLRSQKLVFLCQPLLTSMWLLVICNRSTLPMREEQARSLTFRTSSITLSCT